MSAAGRRTVPQYAKRRAGLVRRGQEAAAALLRVTARPGLAVPVGLVGPAGASRRLKALTVTGWSPRLLAGRLVMDTSSVRRVRDGDRSLIQLGTSQAVSALYREIWDQPPQGTTPERIAAAKARAYAARREWAPPAAWDDDQLDVPAGRPAEGGGRRADGERT